MALLYIKHVLSFPYFNCKSLIISSILPSCIKVPLISEPLTKVTRKGHKMRRNRKTQREVIKLVVKWRNGENGEHIFIDENSLNFDGRTLRHETN